MTQAIPAGRWAWPLSPRQWSLRPGWPLPCSSWPRLDLGMLSKRDHPSCHVHFPSSSSTLLTRNKQSEVTSEVRTDPAGTAVTGQDRCPGARRAPRTSRGEFTQDWTHRMEGAETLESQHCHHPVPSESSVGECLAPKTRGHGGSTVRCLDLTSKVTRREGQKGQGHTRGLQGDRDRAPRKGPQETGAGGLSPSPGQGGDQGDRGCGDRPVTRADAHPWLSELLGKSMAAWQATWDTQPHRSSGDLAHSGTRGLCGGL